MHSPLSAAEQDATSEADPAAAAPRITAMERLRVFIR
jgi:hypothetical protein